MREPSNPTVCSIQRQVAGDTSTRQSRKQRAEKESRSRRGEDMEMASSLAPSTSYSYHNLSVTQAVVTLSINVIIVWLSAVIKSSAAARRRTAAPTTTAPGPARGAKGAGAVDLDVVLGVMGSGGAASVGFEEAAALFEEDEASVEEAAAAFRVFDCDGDGFIDAGELGRVLRSLGFAAGDAAEDCQRMIDAYDEDKDGRIDFQEFLNFMERCSS